MVRGLPKVTTGDPQVWSQTRDSLHVCMLSRSVVSDSLQPPGPVAHQASLSMKFSRQEYWSGWPLPTPGDLPDPRIEPMSLASPALAYGFFTTSSAKPLRLSQSHPCPGSASLTSLPDPPGLSAALSRSLSSQICFFGRCWVVFPPFLHWFIHC